ncbi:MAG: DUF4837 family protein [Saprospiraceae bacterium]|nr:DUF4837 family protein [Saprospiraceae bacterium]
MHSRFRGNSFFFLILIFFGACSEEFTSRLDPLTNALGIASQVTVITDEDMWVGTVGDTFEYYFGAAYPILPQPEPLFDLRHFTPQDLAEDGLRKQLRTYVLLADLSKSDSPTTKLVVKDLGPAKVTKAREEEDYHMAVGYDRWARGQIVIYLFANSQEELMEQIGNRFPSMAKRINDFDEEKVVATVYLAGSSQKLNPLVEETYQMKMDIPNDYFLAIQEGKTIWLRKETDFLSSNILMTEVPYTSKDQFSKKGLKRLRDSLGLKYVSTSSEATFMRINDTDLPMVVTPKNLGGSFGVEARGIWEIENDFMGGPFLSYAVLAPDNSRVIFIDGFVHAPSKEKRKFMQRLEVIFKSINFPANQ